MRLQPMIIGHHYMTSAGQYLATQAALAILEARGNAIDAGGRHRARAIVGVCPSRLAGGRSL